MMAHNPTRGECMCGEKIRNNITEGDGNDNHRKKPQ